MTLWHKRAVVLALVWTAAAAGFLMVSLGGEGPAALGEDTPQRDLAAVFVAVGVVADLVVRFLTRRREGGPAVDERDEMIHRRSTETALWLTVAGVFLLCIALNDAFGKAGTLPVDWLWFMAWCTVAASHLGQALAALVMYGGIFARKPDHAQS